MPPQFPIDRLPYSTRRSHFYTYSNLAQLMPTLTDRLLLLIVLLTGLLVTVGELTNYTTKIPTRCIAVPPAAVHAEDYYIRLIRNNGPSRSESFGETVEAKDSTEAVKLAKSAYKDELGTGWAYKHSMARKEGGRYIYFKRSSILLESPVPAPGRKARKPRPVIVPESQSPHTNASTSSVIIRREGTGLDLWESSGSYHYYFTLRLVRSATSLSKIFTSYSTLLRRRNRA